MDPSIEVSSAPSPIHLLRKMLVAPRDAFPQAAATLAPGILLVLVTAGGLADAAVQELARTGVPASVVLPQLVANLLLGLLGGWVTWLAIPPIAAWLCRKLGGHGTTEELRAVWAWSEVPVALVAIPLLAWVLLAVSSQPGAQVNAPIAGTFLQNLARFPQLWTAALYVFGIATVQRLSLGRALVVAIVSGLIALAVLLLLLMFSLPILSMTLGSFLG